MTNNLKELREEFIATDSLEQQDILDFGSMLLPHCIVDSDGWARLRTRYIREAEQYDKIKAVLSARKIAQELQKQTEEKPSISEVMSNQELSKMLGIDGKGISARLGELAKQGIVEKVSSGKHKIRTPAMKHFIKSLPEQAEDTGDGR